MQIVVYYNFWTLHVKLAVWHIQYILELFDPLEWRFFYNFFSFLFSIQGLGTDEDTLIEILASRNNKEIREINRVYREGNAQLSNYSS